MVCSLLIFTVFQGQHDELEAKFFEERAALEAKYQKLYEPLYSKVSLFLSSYNGAFVYVYMMLSVL